MSGPLFLWKGEAGGNPWTDLPALWSVSATFTRIVSSSLYWLIIGMRGYKRDANEIQIETGGTAKAALSPQGLCLCSLARVTPLASFIGGNERIVNCLPIILIQYDSVYLQWAIFLCRPQHNLDGVLDGGCLFSCSQWPINVSGVCVGTATGLDENKEWNHRPFPSQSYLTDAAFEQFGGGTAGF